MRQLTVNGALTSHRPPRVTVENHDYAAFARRVVTAHGRRIADGDVEGLTALLALADEPDQVITNAVHGLRVFGYSWAEIAHRIGITRQAAQQRWGDKP